MISPLKTLTGAAAIALAASAVTADIKVNVIGHRLVDLARR